MSIGAAPGSRPGLRAFLMLLLGGSLFCITALAAPPRGNKAAADPGKPAAAVTSDFVGADTCSACHEDVVKGFANNPHQKMVYLHGDSGVTCENCHGAGKAHVEGGGDKSKIFNFLTASPKQTDAKCLGCHAGTHPNFQRSPHAKADVSCTGCHSIHGSQEKGTATLQAAMHLVSTNPSRAGEGNEHLLKAPQPQLCFGCHNDVRPSFGMPFHHKVNEGLVTCSDCHNVHGTFGNNNLRSTADQNHVCTKCHTDVRGPFVFEHTPVKSEGCLACHTPHGSQNARLLNMPSIATLCNQCHSPVATHNISGMGQGSFTATPCINCHTMIHGSNMSQAFIR